jgi:MFS family permease
VALGLSWGSYPSYNVLWSLASGASGMATTFVALLLTRCLVGIGEAAYGPVAPAIISDLYPVKIRGRVLARFYVAIPVGSALGYVLGGWVANSGIGDWGAAVLGAKAESWRWAFYLVVPPGILLFEDPPLHDLHRRLLSRVFTGPKLPTNRVWSSEEVISSNSKRFSAIWSLPGGSDFLQPGFPFWFPAQLHSAASPESTVKRKSAKCFYWMLLGDAGCRIWRIENPRVGGSMPPLATSKSKIFRVTQPQSRTPNGGLRPNRAH